MGNADGQTPSLHSQDLRFSAPGEGAYPGNHTDTSVLEHGGGRGFRRRRRDGSKKSLLRAYLFALPPIGIFGGHHFYLGRPEFGLLYFFTCGLMGLGWFLDLCRLPCIVQGVNKQRAEVAAGNRARPEKNIIDAYILWMPLGILGFHHYYLGRWPWAVAYTFTFGLAGAGWLFDGCRMEALVKEANLRRKSVTQQPEVDPEQLPGGLEYVSLVDSYVLGLSVFGLLGAHHYYLGRFFVGMVYTFSAGLLGIGWICDWFTMSVLFKRAQHIRKNGDDGLCYLDDAYRFLWPLGFLGLHHFYLRRPARGFLYLFTLGLFAIGWIYDFFKLPSLVKEANRRVLEERAHLAEIQERLGPNTRVMGNQHYYVAYPTRDPITGGATCPSSSSSSIGRILPVQVGVPPQYSCVVNVSSASPSEPPPSYQTVATPSAITASMGTISEEQEEEQEVTTNAYVHPTAPHMPKGMDNLGYGNMPSSDGNKKML